MAAPKEERSQHVGSQKMTKDQRKAVINDIKEHEKLFLESRGHSNSLVELLEIVQSDDKSITAAAVKSLHKIFSHLFSKDALTSAKAKPTSKKGDSEREDASMKPEDQYKAWLQDRYHDCLRCLARGMENFSEAPAVQELCLCSLMKLLQAESNHPLRTKELQGYVFPVSVLSHVVPKLLSKDLDMKDLISRFQEYLEYDDIRFHVLIQVRLQLAKVAKEDAKQDLATLCNNTFALLEHVTMPTAEEDINNFMCRAPQDDDEAKIMSLKEHRRHFSDAWLIFLGLTLPPAIYKKTLVILHEAVMPHLTNPLLLTDFLTISYSIGGAISLLALNGLFILITKHNLEYPEFYKKLYALFEPSIFHVKYRARFFHLANLFLSSTYLPAYLVAAFAKRLSRLALTAPPTALTLVIPFVGNLLHRHPSCQVMVHKTNGPSELEDDPYIMAETDPAKCRAMDSSLWEMQTLKSHYHPGVATAAAWIDRPLPKEEWDVSEYLELSTAEMIGWVANKKMRTAPIEFEPPKGLFGEKDDTFAEFWTYD
ncbi:nucleolar complex protein 4 homolog [Patiria miniata]|uniref:CCAAT-binding factor domain-containing protein n=1 Tax=Patiria miniata TaxID=46514 RepID=A0A913ZSW9_PATMI|nr:nucleolar complex protein 4 homolog [Patiria miniata]